MYMCILGGGIGIDRQRPRGKEAAANAKENITQGLLPETWGLSFRIYVTGVVMSKFLYM